MISESKEKSKQNGIHAVETDSTELHPLVIDNLNLFYRDQPVLKGINLTIPANKVTALIGPSGSGKSTLLRCLNRMVELSADVTLSGQIQVNGQNVLSPDVDTHCLRRQVGMVFQKPVIFPRSIYENLIYGLKVNHLSDKIEMRRIADHCLEQVGLSDELRGRLNDPALSLTEGQRQRLCIARALAVQPQVLLFDDPCATLDPISTGRVEELILSLKADHTIIMVTHNLQQAARISEYTAFIMMGEVIEFNSTNKVFTKPTDSRTLSYITGRIG